MIQAKKRPVFITGLFFKIALYLTLQRIIKRRVAEYRVAISKASSSDFVMLRYLFFNTKKIYNYILSFLTSNKLTKKNNLNSY